MKGYYPALLVRSCQPSLKGYKKKKKIMSFKICHGNSESDDQRLLSSVCSWSCAVDNKVATCTCTKQTLMTLFTYQKTYSRPLASNAILLLNPSPLLPQTVHMGVFIRQLVKESEISRPEGGRLGKWQAGNGNAEENGRASSACPERAKKWNAFKSGNLVSDADVAAQK